MILSRVASTRLRKQNDGCGVTVAALLDEGAFLGLSVLCHIVSGRGGRRLGEARSCKSSHENSAYDEFCSQHFNLQDSIPRAGKYARADLFHLQVTAGPCGPGGTNGHRSCLKIFRVWKLGINRWASC